MKCVQLKPVVCSRKREGGGRQVAQSCRVAFELICCCQKLWLLLLSAPLCSRPSKPVGIATGFELDRFLSLSFLRSNFPFIHPLLITLPVLMEPVFSGPTRELLMKTRSDWLETSKRYPQF